MISSLLMESDLAVDLRHLTKRFGSVTAVNDLTLQVASGEIVAFLGPNGAGKTTTIDMLLGLTRPDVGTARVYGRLPVDAIGHGEVSAVMQNSGLLRDFTVRETVAVHGLVLRSCAPVGEVLERAGIAGIADRRVGKCSGGEQQRLRFAMALLSDPRLLVLDEPTTGMDVQGRRDFWSSIRRDAEHGRTVMFATHYIDEADAHADRIVLIRQGVVVADGTTSEIKNLASGRVVRATLSNAAGRTPPGVARCDKCGNAGRHRAHTLLRLGRSGASSADSDTCPRRRNLIDESGSGLRRAHQ